MWGRHQKSQRVVLQLAALALFCNALIPAGFMLHPVAHGGMTVVLCPGQGAMPGFPADDHHRSLLEQASPADTRMGDEGTCLFAVATGPVLSASVLTLAPVEFVSPLALTLTHPVIRPPTRSAATLRGPPALS